MLSAAMVFSGSLFEIHGAYTIVTEMAVTTFLFRLDYPD